MNTKDIFSKKIKELRTAKKITRKELAEAIQVSPASIGYYENGMRVPDIETLVKLSDYFNVSADFLIRGVTSKNININSDLGLSDGAVLQIKNIKDSKPINTETGNSLLMEFFNKVIESDRFTKFLRNYYEYAICFNAFLAINDFASSETSELFAELFNPINENSFCDYKMFCAMHELIDIARKEHGYYGNHDYEDYFDNYIENMLNKIRKEASDNAEHKSEKE